ncbi:MAG TPA: ATP-binding protein [Thermoanaerobaculia bacterium]|nr:ATP-binding protein [Thermoanaerobaculia bacterium]
MAAGLAVTAAVVAVIAFALLFRTRSRLREMAMATETERNAIRSRAEGAENLRDLLLQILQEAGEAFLAIDRRRRVVLTNRKFRALFDAEGELEGRPLAEVARVNAVLTTFETALAGRAASATFSIPPAPSERLVDMHARPIGSEEIAAVAVFTDVTRLRRLEQIRQDFISDFSHEVRTPLAALRSALESYEIARGRMTEEEDWQLRRIMARQLARLERLVDDLSELSNIESGEIALDRHPVDLRQMIADLCEDFGDQAAQRGIRFDLRGGGATVNADVLRLQQAFSNLIDNAIKYGGEKTTVEIEVTGTPDAGVVRITDHGEGIAPEEHDRIFHRFYRVDRSRSQKVLGTGLGLAIARHIVLRHGGTIALESTPGAGSTFMVRLPK